MGNACYRTSENLEAENERQADMNKMELRIAEILKPLLHRNIELEAENERLRERYYKLNANWLKDSASLMWARGWCHVCGCPILPPKYNHAVDCGYEVWAVENRPSQDKALGGE